MQKKVTTICKNSILVLLICLFTLFPAVTGYYSGYSGGLQVVLAAGEEEGGVPSNPTYNDWLSGWATGTTYEGSTLSFDDYEEREMNDPNSASDWIANASEFAFAFLIKKLVVSTAIVISEDLGATVDAVVYGRVGTGSDVSAFHFGLEDGNVFGVVGAIIYAVLRGVVFVLLAIQLLYIIGTYLVKGTGKGRSDLKGALYDFLFMFVMLYAMPIIVSIFLYLRDALLKSILDITQTIGGSYNLGVFDMMFNGTKDDWTIAGAIVLACVAAGGIYFAYEYIRLAVSMTYLFGIFPMVAFRSFSDKNIFNKWISYFIVNLFIPVIDATGLMIVLLVQSNATDISAADGHYRLLVVIAYLCIIPCRNLVLQLFGQPIPGRGFNIAAAAMMAARFLSGGGKEKQVNKDDKGTKENGGSSENGDSSRNGDARNTIRKPGTGDESPENNSQNPAGGGTSGFFGVPGGAADADTDTDKDTVSAQTADTQSSDVDNTVISSGDQSPVTADAAAGTPTATDEIIQDLSTDDLGQLADASPSSSLDYLTGGESDVPQASSEMAITGQEGELADLSSGIGDGNGASEEKAGERLEGKSSEAIDSQVADGEEPNRAAGNADEQTPLENGNAGEAILTPQEQADLEVWQGGTPGDKCTPCALSDKDIQSGDFKGSRIHNEDGSRETLLTEQGAKKIDKEHLPEGVQYNPPKVGTANTHGSITESKGSWASDMANTSTGGEKPYENVLSAKARFYSMQRSTFAPVEQKLVAGAKVADGAMQKLNPNYVGAMAKTPDGKWDYKTDFANASRTLTKVTSGAAAVALGGTAAAVMATSGDPVNAAAAAMAVGGVAHEGVTKVGDTITDKVQVGPGETFSNMREAGRYVADAVRASKTSAAASSTKTFTEKDARKEVKNTAKEEQDKAGKNAANQENSPGEKGNAQVTEEASQGVAIRNNPVTTNQTEDK